MENVLLKEKADVRSTSHPSTYTRKRADDIFFTTMSVIMLAIVFMEIGRAHV